MSGERDRKKTQKSARMREISKNQEMMMLIGQKDTFSKVTRTLKLLALWKSQRTLFQHYVQRMKSVISLPLTALLSLLLFESNNAFMPLLGSRSNLSHQVHHTQVSGVANDNIAQFLEQAKSLVDKADAAIAQADAALDLGQGSIASKQKNHLKARRSKVFKMKADLMARLEAHTDALKGNGGMGNYESKTVPQLKELLRSKGLRVGGKKSELIERLMAATTNP